MILSNPGYDLNDFEYSAYMETQQSLLKAIKNITVMLDHYSKMDMEYKSAMYAAGEMLKEIDDINKCVTYYEKMVALDINTQHDVLLSCALHAETTILHIQSISSNLLAREQKYLKEKERKERRPKIIGMGIGLLVLVCVAFVYFKLT